MAKSNPAIDRLIDRVREVAASAHNCSRGQLRPVISFSLEDPGLCSRGFGHDARRYFTDPVFYFEQSLLKKLWFWENLPEDDIALTLDLPAWLGHYPEYTFFDLSVEYDAFGVPAIQSDHPLTRRPDLSLLKAVDFRSSGWMPRILRWYDDLCAIAAGRLNVTFNMTWWRGCLDLAMQLRGYENFVADLVERPGFVRDLLSFLTEQRCRWHEAYCRHFGLPLSAASIGDDWLNVPFISPQVFRDFVLPRYLEIERFHGSISSIHSCGNQAPLQRYLLEIRSLNTFEVSPWTSLPETLANVPPDKHLCIALHPTDAQYEHPDRLEERMRSVAHLCRGRQFSYAMGFAPERPSDLERYIARVRLCLRLAHRAFDATGAQAASAMSS